MSETHWSKRPQDDQLEIIIACNFGLRCGDNISSSSICTLPHKTHIEI